MVAKSTLDPGPAERDPLQLVSALLQVSGFVVVLITFGVTLNRYRDVDSQPNIGELLGIVENLTYLTGSLVLILAFLGFFYSKRARTIRDKTVLIEVLREKNSTLEGNSVLICNYFQAIAKEHYQYCSFLYTANPNKDQVMAALNGYIDAVLINTSLIFSLYSHGPCAACLKLFTDGSQELAVGSFGLPPMQYVKTMRRDAISRINRQSIDESPACKSYKYQLNTAFAHIVDIVDAPDYFASDDLIALGDAYKNENKQWSSFYNAAIVVPVKPPGRSAHEICTGFLCVDNMQGGLCTDEAKYMMEEVAVMIYLAMEMSVTHLGEI